jgi:hypothetical protein
MLGIHLSSNIMLLYQKHHTMSHCTMQAHLMSVKAQLVAGLDTALAEERAANSVALDAERNKLEDVLRNLDTAQRDASLARSHMQRCVFACRAGRCKHASKHMQHDRIINMAAELIAASAPAHRLAAGYAAKADAALDARWLAAAWFGWRRHLARQRRLARQAMRAERYYVTTWLLSRAWRR